MFSAILFSTFSFEFDRTKQDSLRNRRENVEGKEIKKEERKAKNRKGKERRKKAKKKKESEQKEKKFEGS